MEVSDVTRQTMNDQKETANRVQAKPKQEEKRSGYGDKKLEGPDRPST